jgi:glutaredoxin
METPAILIGLNNCLNCTSAKDFLRQKKIPCLYYNLNDLPKSVQQELVNCKRANQIKKINAPLLIYNQRLYSGFDEEEYDSIFTKEGV